MGACEGMHFSQSKNAGLLNYFVNFKKKFFMPIFCHSLKLELIWDHFYFKENGHPFSLAQKMRDFHFQPYFSKFFLGIK